MTLERDEILALIQTDPEAIVTIIQTLEKRIADLERQLNMNSRNSSRPPSTDGFKRPQKKRKRTGKLPGGQEGHEGHTLE